MPHSEFVSAALLEGFGARATAVTRVRAGTDTVNHRAVLDDERRVFVKTMRPGQAEAASDHLLVTADFVVHGLVVAAA